MTTPYMLRMLRREARRSMTGRCDIARGEWPDVTTVYTDLPCVPRPQVSRANREVESGDQTVALSLYDVRVPFDTEAERGDVLTVTASNDPGLVGRYLTVIEVTYDEWVSVRTLACREGRS